LVGPVISVHGFFTSGVGKVRVANRARHVITPIAFFNGLMARGTMGKRIFQLDARHLVGSAFVGFLLVPELAFMAKRARTRSTGPLLKSKVEAHKSLAENSTASSCHHPIMNRFQITLVHPPKIGSVHDLYRTSDRGWK
jgi:hypothetical protein